MTPRVSLSLVAFVLTLLATASGQTVLYRSVGGDVVLVPPRPHTSAIISNVLWKHDDNLAVEWEGEIHPTEEYGPFKDQSYLNRSNAELTLKNLTQRLSGVYVVEINNHVIPGSITLFVISGVPKPHISVNCTAEQTKCTLTCEGDVKAMSPEPTYIWKFNNQEQTHPHPRLDITPENSAPEFICELKNRVSHESSEPFDNPFRPRPGLKVTSRQKVITGLVVMFCLLALVLGLVLGHRFKSGMWFFQKDSEPWEPDFWQKTERQAEPPSANDQPGEGDVMMESRS
ncbi:cell adhesion molecule CEACAM5-like isoform X2 [Eucyclogobius newberryi]|uniref:cell adhesion molecule CEACAM5-like isoform X2 n=1 Tax=Eucyclogobius newberryi TaxID=166745 RepID=UPI003B5C97AD